MSKKVLAFIYVTVIVLSLSATAILLILMPECELCGKKFCFGTCQNVAVLPAESEEEGERENAPKTSQNTTRLVETPRAPDDYLDKITFIGDSRTVALEFFEVPKSQIYAENSLTHVQAMTKNVVSLNDDKFTTIEEAVTVTAPDIMIINFGINGAAWMPDEEFSTTYEEFVDQMLTASPSSIIVLESILPVSIDYENRSDGIKNERVDELNDMIYKIAKRKGLYYMASNEALKDDRNTLGSEYSADGLHFNSKAYEVLLDYFYTHAIYREE